MGNFVLLTERAERSVKKYSVLPPLRGGNANRYLLFKGGFTMKRRILAASIAAVTALTSTGVCAFADGQDSEALASVITIAKTRLDIPEELTEFSYNTYDRFKTTTYDLTWSTPTGTDDYKSVSVTVCGSLILSYFDSSSYTYINKDSDKHFAKLSGDRLYKKAQAALKKINPTVADVISIDRDSLNISMYNSEAMFSFVRTKNGVPVSNDRGTIVLDKDTGALKSFSMNWHINAAFKDNKTAISEDKAKQKYAEMIQLTPQYEIDYDWQTKKVIPRLVYRQSDFGEINAFTGKKSDFSADGYYETNDMVAEEDAALETGKGDGGYQFTEAEQAELDRNLPYASSEAVIKLMQADKWLTYSTDMELVSSDLYKVSFTGKDKYYYTANFSSYVPDENDYVYEEIIEEDGSVSVPAYESDKDWQEVNITVDAESGQIMSYYFWDTRDSRSSSYDLDKADKLAEEIAKTYVGEHYAEYKAEPSSVYSWTDNNNAAVYNGSSHTWIRYYNDISVCGDYINIGFNADMKLTSYNFSYTDIELPDPSNMISVDKVMQKFWENNDLNLYYLARFTDKKTKTVLVYGTDSDVYVDAFTGDPVYDWQYYSERKNDLSGIKDKEILKMAKALGDHGFIISTEKFSEKDTADSAIFEQLMGISSDQESKKLTRGDALVIFTKSVAGDMLPELKGIYKSPFSDVKDTDKNVGYYAIAYAMGVVSGDKLNEKSDFTYGDMIKMVYTFYTAE